MVYKFKNTITVAAGSGSGNTLPIHGMCRYIYIEPTTASTTYKANIVDDDSDTVKNLGSSEWTKGTLRDFTPLIMEGIYTLNITDSTANEDFTAKMLIEEL